MEHPKSDNYDIRQVPDPATDQAAQIFQPLSISNACQARGAACFSEKSCPKQHGEDGGSIAVQQEGAEGQDDLHTSWLDLPFGTQEPIMQHWWPGRIRSLLQFNHDCRNLCLRLMKRLTFLASPAAVQWLCSTNSLHSEPSEQKLTGRYAAVETLVIFLPSDQKELDFMGATSKLKHISLILVGNHQLTLQFIQSIAHHLPNLQHLKLTKGRQVLSDAGLAGLCSLTHLTSLILSGSGSYMASVLHSLPTCLTALRSLEVTELLSLDGTAAEVIAQLTWLTRLVLGMPLTDAGTFPHLPEMLLRLTKLQHLALPFVPPDEDSMALSNLQDLAQSVQHLTSLTALIAPSLSVSPAVFNGTSFPFLQHLVCGHALAVFQPRHVLPNCMYLQLHQPTSTQLRYLPHCCPNLCCLMLPKSDLAINWNGQVADGLPFDYKRQRGRPLEVGICVSNFSWRRRGVGLNFIAAIDYMPTQPMTIDSILPELRSHFSHIRSLRMHLRQATEQQIITLLITLPQLTDLVLTLAYQAQASTASGPFSTANSAKLIIDSPSVFNRTLRLSLPALSDLQVLQRNTELQDRRCLGVVFDNDSEFTSWEGAADE